MSRPTTSRPALPTASLPSLKLIDTLSPVSIALALKGLYELYHPHLRPTSRRLLLEDIDSGYASEADDCIEDDDNEEAWEVTRSDEFERAYAIRWITGFVARSASWAAIASTDQDADDREMICDEVARLLAMCAQMSESGDLDRHFSFPTRGNGEVRVVLMDKSLSTTDHTSVGMQTWGSASVLGEKMVWDPTAYGLRRLSDPKRPLRILELGAGTGLLSLLLGSSAAQDEIPLEIVATDFHPDVLDNLRTNVSQNPSSTCSLVSIDVETLDWQDFYDSPDALLPSPFDRPFDVIIAADVIYRPAHAEWIKCTVARLLRQPSIDDPTPMFHLIAPLRPTHEHTRSSIESAFPFRSASTTPVGPPRLVILDVEESDKVKSVGRADESSYRLYRIGWDI